MKTRNLTPFVPASPSKKSVGKGSLYGTFNPPPEHMAEQEQKKVRPAGPVELGKRNFLTNPMKKGGYGYYHTTIGGFEYPHSVEPAGGAKTRSYTASGAERGGAGGSGAGGRMSQTTTGISHPRPFCSTSHGNRLFTGNAIYAPQPPLSSSSASDTSRSRTLRSRGASGTQEVRAPFRSMCAPGYTIGKFPEYKVVPDPRAANPREGIKHENIWKPSGTDTFTPPTKSIATLGLTERKIFNRSRGL